MTLADDLAVSDGTLRLFLFILLIAVLIYMIRRL